VPTPKGFVTLKEGSRAVVYPYITGRPLSFAHLPAGPGIAAELGRALAALHNVDLALCEEAGLTSYDPDTYRTRRLSDLDRAAATGHVPTALLSRWERSLEEVSLWRFAPTPTHGDLTGDEVLAAFGAEDDATTGRICGLTGWENAKVADPADDFATLVTQASLETLDSVLEAYADARTDRPDPHLERRARLAGELKLVSELLVAVGSKSQSRIEACAGRLRKLDADTVDDLDEEALPAAAPTAQAVPHDPDVTDESVPQGAEVTETLEVYQDAEVTETLEVSQDPEVTEPLEVPQDPEVTETIDASRGAGVSEDTDTTETVDVSEDTDVTDVRQQHGTPRS
jgi:hypothetical protein